MIPSCLRDDIFTHRSFYASTFTFGGCKGACLNVFWAGLKRSVAGGYRRSSTGRKADAVPQEITDLVYTGI